MLGPIPHCEPSHAHSAGVASGTVARRLRIDVHDNNDDNDNAWQRDRYGPMEWTQWIMRTSEWVKVHADRGTDVSDKDDVKEQIERSKHGQSQSVRHHDLRHRLLHHRRRRRGAHLGGRLARVLRWRHIRRRWRHCFVRVVVVVVNVVDGGGADDRVPDTDAAQNHHQTEDVLVLCTCSTSTTPLLTSDHRSSTTAYHSRSFRISNKRA